MNGYATKVVFIEPVPSKSLNEKLKGKLILNNNTIPFEISANGKFFQELKDIFFSLDYCKYRLSLYYKWNPYEKKYVSTITKINSEMNDLFYIHCSKEYRKLLDFFQQINNMEQLEDLNNNCGIKFFIDEPIQTVNIDNEKIEMSDTNSDKDQFKKGNIKASLLIGSGTIIVCICLLIIIEYIYSNNKTIAESKNGFEEEISKIKNIVHDNRTVHSKTIIPTTIEEEVPFTYFDIEEQVIYGLPEGKIALTFDDGPSIFTEKIVDILLEYNIGATFFFVGSRAKLYPDSVNYVRDHHMIVANHSWSHSNFLNLSEETRLHEVNSTNEILGIVENDSVLFRPPYGIYNNDLIKQLNDEFKFVLWNRDPKDWNARSEEEIIDYFLTSNPSGAIYILHENEYTVSALPQIIEWIQQHEVDFVILK